MESRTEPQPKPQPKSQLQQTSSAPSITSIPPTQPSTTLTQPSQASQAHIKRPLKRLRKLSDSESVQKEEDNVQVSVFEDEDSDHQPLRERKRIKRKIVDARKRVRDAGKRDRDEKEEARLNEYIDEPDEPSDPEEEDFSQALGYESLGTRYPIVSFETKLYGETSPYMCHLVRRADKSGAWYGCFRRMLWDFDRTDVLTLRDLVMDKFAKSTPTGIDLDLWGILELMFNPNEENEVWQNQDQWEITRWELIEQSGIHVLQLSNGMIFYLLTEKKYPFTATTMMKMLDHKLLAIKGDILAHDLLKSITNWLHEENERLAKEVAETKSQEGSSKGQNP